MNAFSWFLLVFPSSALGLPLCIDRDVLQWCDVLCGPLVAQVGMSVPRLWGANMTRAGCTGRRLLMLCRVSVLLLAVVVAQVVLQWLVSFQFFIPFNTLLVTLPGLFNFFLSIFVSFSKYSEAGLLYFFSNSFAVCCLIFCLAWVGLLCCYQVIIISWLLGVLYNLFLSVILGTISIA